MPLWIGKELLVVLVLSGFTFSEFLPGFAVFPFVQTPGDCGFLRWIDRQATPYERTLLCDLRDAIRQMKREKAEEEQQMQLARRQLSDQMQVIQQLEKDKDELKNKMEQMELKQGKNGWLCLIYVVVVLLGLWFGLVYSAL